MTHSLLQLHDDGNERLAVFQNIQEGFVQSHANLQAVVEANSQTCTNLKNNYKEVEASLNERISNNENKDIELSTSINLAVKTIAENKDKIGEETESMNQNAISLKEENKNLIEKENEINETINVLNRLRNIALDELTGDLKKNTEMGKYDVVNEHGVSFIQKFNFNQELRNLMGKSNTSAKGLISTLIMMTASNDHFSDPAIVKKVTDVLDRIIASNQEKLNHLSSEFEQTTGFIKDLISNSRDLIDNLNEANTKLQFLIEFNTRQQLDTQRDTTTCQEALKRRQTRSLSNQEYCNRLVSLVENYEKNYSNISVKMDELRAKLQE
jgi:hypothetical protein